jgi:hypothetical protein
MHERNSSSYNTISTNAQIQAPIKTESTAVMYDMWNVETVQYGSFAEAAGG